MRIRVLVMVSAIAVGSACADDSTTEPVIMASADDSRDDATTTSPLRATTQAPRTTAPAPPAVAETIPTEESVPTFVATVHEVTAAELGPSWREGCPVGVDELRRIEMPHHDGTGEVAVGSLVVHRDHVDDVVTVFDRLFDAAFPIHSMQPVSVFDADDNASMAADNTSAFNCREIAGRPGVWSQHSFGGAIDINPLINPWVRGDQVDPPGGAPFVDREQDLPGLIRAGDVVTEAFAAIGWGWGGDWSGSKDYQHFSHNGR